MEVRSKIATILKDSKNEILEVWEASVRSQIYSVRSESSSILRDSIPEFLDDLVLALKQGIKELSPEILRFAHHHGAERAFSEKFSIEDAISEYNILRKTIFAILENKVQITPVEREILLEGLNLGITKAGAEYVKLQLDKQKKIETLLKKSEEEFRTNSNALPQIIWTASPDGFVYWYNDWYYKYTGLSPDRDNWKNTQVIHPDDMPSLLESWQQSLKTGEPTHLEFRILRGVDRTYRWHLSRGVPIRDEQHNIIRWVGSNTDIENLKRTQKNLEEEKILREKFVSTLTHDLRTPLTAAKMNAQLIQRKVHEDPAPKLSLRIVENLNLANDMIEDLLDATRLRAGEKIIPDFQRIDLVEVVKDTIDNLVAIHGERFKFESPSSLEALLSPSGMRRIVENLCSNAVKYGDPREDILIMIESHKHYFSLCVHNKTNPQMIIDKSKLFEPFQRGPADTIAGIKGWGIGLTIVKGITEAHHGEVAIENSQVGTTFKIKIPI